MSGIIRTACLLAIASLVMLSLATVSNHTNSQNSAGLSQPLPIREGPMGVSNAFTVDPYWFQQGVQGDSSTYNSVGARVSIRTVFDNVNNDAHSYWVGSILANDAFVQVGYLNGLSTTGHYYCCSWFYEYFPPGNTISPPIIGPPGSAGPIGSWHTYTMNYTRNGIWNFYMDNQYLGSSPAAGDLYYLGDTDTNSGNHAVAALSEVAQTTVNTDVIGPAEFRGFQYETSPNGWTNVSPGRLHWGYGATSQTNLKNPYGVAEIVGLQNDFVTGSILPYPPGSNQPGLDECGNQASGTANLWPIVCVPPLSSTSFSFVDEVGGSIVPPWISLSDSAGNLLFYTDYQNYAGVNIPSPTGQWRVSQVSWHSVNVTIDQVVNMSAPSQVFSTSVFPITLAVVGYIYALPVKGAPVILYLPDSTNQTQTTDDNGEAFFTQLPPSTYTVHIAVPYGLTSGQVHDIAGPGSIIAKVFSLPELITIIVPPILLTLLVAIVVVRKERQRQAMIQQQAQMQPAPVAPLAMSCRSCGNPLAPTANFCTRCGTPVRMTVQ